MIITINTKEDSKDELRKIISMLNALVNEQGTAPSDFTPVVGQGMFGLFDNPAPPAAAGTPEPNKEDKMEIYEY